ncbi:hypothetical protein LEP1GSC115_4374 [Leptospira interrogans serovar Australis str. 200703203]|uniref:Uncharacterized protein n=1 Tax=Leptospira interrogans serovar Australis str. 200703203 TaxID=1085541 RepID=N1U8R4_LEPIR|nr:hypothetical protein LEP1GSC115_4374 [Leptospira interrogans serovar Australis str. 200703203]
MDLQLDFKNCGNYYKIQKESLSSRLCANCCFAAIIKIEIQS